mgnify:CR=1 FL=1
MLLLVSACANTAAGEDGAITDVGGRSRDAGASSDGSVADSAAAPGFPQPNPRAPRLMAPLSHTRATNRRPTLRWALPSGSTGARIEICRDRACMHLDETLNVTGDHARPTAELSPGPHFWRAVALEGDTARTELSWTWMFHVGVVSTPSDYAAGVIADLNGDGYGELLARVESDQGRADWNAPLLVIPGSESGLQTEASWRQPIEAAYPIGDVNGDGLLDLVRTRMLGEGYEGISPEVQIVHGSEVSSSSNSQTIQLPGDHLDHFWEPVGDTNHDGYADLFIRSYVLPFWQIPGTLRIDDRSTFMAVYLGQRDGLTDSQRILRPDTFPMGGESNLHATFVLDKGDMTGDGISDWVVRLGYIQSERVFIYPGSGVGWPVSTPIELRVPEGQSIYVTDGTPCDFNGDGLADIAAVGVSVAFLSQSLLIYFGSREIGIPYEPGYVSHPFTNPRAQSYQGAFCAEMNGDRYSDFLIQEGARSLVWYPGGPNGLGSSRVLWEAPEGFTIAYGVAIGDVDGNGIADIVIGSASEILTFSATSGGVPAITSRVPFEALGIHLQEREHVFLFM